MQGDSRSGREASAPISFCYGTRPTVLGLFFAAVFILLNGFFVAATANAAQKLYIRNLTGGTYNKRNIYRAGNTTFFRHHGVTDIIAQEFPHFLITAGEFGHLLNYNIRPHYFFFHYLVMLLQIRKVNRIGMNTEKKVTLVIISNVSLFWWGLINITCSGRDDFYIRQLFF